MKVELLQDGGLKLCCHKRCPVLRKVDDKYFEIEDDFGGKVKLTPQEVKSLSMGINLSLDNEFENKLEEVNKILKK